MVLSSAQQNAVINGEPLALTVGDTECVLLRKDIYLKLDPEHDFGPWTAAEMDLLADEADEILSRKEAHGS